MFCNLQDLLQVERINNYFNDKGIKHVTRLHLGLSDLRDHKFKHGFLDSLNPI